MAEGRTEVDPPGTLPMHFGTWWKTYN
jgi:hypothetical protein